MKNKRWTKEDVAWLLDFDKLSELSYDEKWSKAAKELGRTPASIRQKVYEQNHPPRVRTKQTQEPKKVAPPVEMSLTERLDRLQTTLVSLACELENVSQEVALIENWVKDTLTLKRKLTKYSVDGHGVMTSLE